MKHTLEEIIQKNEDYIKELEQKIDPDMIDEQYLDIAKSILERLKALRDQKILFPRGFYHTLIDDFDIYSKFYGELARFITDNPDKVTKT